MQVDYEFNKENNKFEVSRRQTKESFKANLSLLVRWSPYSTEAELLKQVKLICAQLLPLFLRLTQWGMPLVSSLHLYVLV